MSHPRSPDELRAEYELDHLAFRRTVKALVREVRVLREDVAQLVHMVDRVLKRRQATKRRAKKKP